MCHFLAPVGNRKWCAKTSCTGICTLLWYGTRAGSFMLHSKTDSSRSGKKYAVCSLFWHQHVQSYGLQSFSLPRNLLNYKALPKRGARQTGRTVFQGPVSYPQWWIPIVLQLFSDRWIFFSVSRIRSARVSCYASPICYLLPCRSVVSY